MTDKSELKKMSLVEKLHQGFVIEKIKNTDWEHGSSSPLIVELDTTEACNLACRGCISEEITNKANSFTNEHLLRLAKELNEAGVKGVILIGGGEPLAHHAAGDLITYLGENDISIGITTNGVFIDKHLDAISKYSSWTRVSVDAATSEMFDHLRPSKCGKPTFTKVIENMRKLAEKKKGKLGYSFLIRTPADGHGIKSNISEIYDAAKLAKDIGCDYFEVKPSYEFENNKDHFLRPHDPKDMKHAEEEIARLIELETDSFKVLKSINLEFSLEGKQHFQPKEYEKCPVAELRTLITPSGCYICPYFRGKEEKKIGNVREESFLDMWQGKQRKEAMKNLNTKQHCKMHCIRHSSNLELFRIINKIKKNEEIETRELETEDRFI